MSKIVSLLLHLDDKLFACQIYFDGASQIFYYRIEKLNFLATKIWYGIPLQKPSLLDYNLRRNEGLPEMQS
jgi:hypothetical protein